MTLLDNPARRAWLASRKKGLGGSDAAAVLGLSPYRSAFEVWLDKTGRFDEDAPTEAMEWGLRLEDAIALAYEEKTGHRLARPPGIVCHPERSWQCASLDRWVVDDNGEPVAVWEAKTASPFDDSWDFYSFEPAIPDYVRLQAQHCMAVTDMGVCHGAVLVGGSKFHTFSIQRDDGLIADLTAAEERWWVTYVLGDKPPPVDGSDATTDTIRAMFPDSTEGTEIDLPSDAAGLVARWCEAKARAKQAKADAEEAGNRLRILLGDAEAGRIDGTRAVTWRSHPERRLDVDRLRDEQPDIAAAYTNESTVRPLRLARGYRP